MLKKMLNIFAFLNVYSLKPNFGSSRSYGKRLENPKTVASRELFLPENEIKASFAVNFPKKHPEFGALEINHACN